MRPPHRRPSKGALSDTGVLGHIMNDNTGGYTFRFCKGNPKPYGCTVLDGSEAVAPAGPSVSLEAAVALLVGAFGLGVLQIAASLVHRPGVQVAPALASVFFLIGP